MIEYYTFTSRDEKLLANKKKTIYLTKQQKTESKKKNAQISSQNSVVAKFYSMLHFIHFCRHLSPFYV